MGFFRGPNIVRENLIGHWDDGSYRSYKGSGTVYKNLVDGGEATANNLTHDGTRFDYNGTTGYVDCGRSFTDQSDLTKNIATGESEYTLEAWIYCRSTPGGTTSGYEIVGNNSATGVGIHLQLVSSNIKVNFGYRTNSNFDSNSNLSLNTWYHIVGTRNKNLAAYNHIWINGVDDIGSGTTGVLDVDANSANMMIGETAARITGEFDGFIPIVRIYNSYLTGDQIVQNFNAQRERFGI